MASNLEARSVAFSSLNEAIDTGSVGGKMIFHVFAALAEFERSLIRKRTRAGLEAARTRGRKGGRPRKMSPDHVRKAKAMLLDPYMTSEIKGRPCLLPGHTRPTHLQIQIQLRRHIRYPQHRRSSSDP